MTSSVKVTAQAALFARYGVPQQVRPDEVDGEGFAVVRVYAVGSLEAAQAFVYAERGMWGNPARAELRDGVGWVVVVDLRRKISEHRRTIAVRRSLWSR